MRLVVVRHGERKGNRLTAAGEEMSRATGQWIAKQGIRPVRVVVSTRRWTADTARLILEAFPDIALPESGWRSENTPETKTAWLALVGDVVDGVAGDVLMVVHSESQGFVERLHGGAAKNVPRDNHAAAYVLELEDGEWRCIEACRGEPKSR